MKSVIPVYKPVGKTPLEVIKQLQIHHPRYQGQKIAYAGRLDPMAEGLLLLLVGDECKKRTSYEQLPKTYFCRAVFGLSSDTYDILGIVKKNFTGKINLDEKDISALLPQYSGTILQPYPPYSSVRVKGKPLFYWARRNILNKIEIPSKSVSIYSFKQLSFQRITFHEIISDVTQKVSSVRGDFRQSKALKSWKTLSLNQGAELPVASFEVSCSSGTYIRSLIHELGEQIGWGAITLSIKRTKVGDFSVRNALRLSNHVQV